MLKLNRIGSEVYCGDKKLTIISQTTKGANKEVVKIEGLEGANGQKYISLIRLKEGLNEIECQGRDVTIGYYTADEQKRLSELYAEIAEIKAAAKKRQVVKPKTQNDINKMSRNELEAYMGYLSDVLNKKISI